MSTRPAKAVIPLRPNAPRLADKGTSLGLTFICIALLLTTAYFCQPSQPTTYSFSLKPLSLDDIILPTPKLLIVSSIATGLE